jgi:hypothetical protein
MSEDEFGLGTEAEFLTSLATDVLLQLAGMEQLAGLRVDLQRIDRDVRALRDQRVLERLADVVDADELAALGDPIPLAAVQRRLPHAEVLFVHETSVALNRFWPLFEKAREEKE